MINKSDFLVKELVDSFSYCDIHTNRNDSRDFVLYGRTHRIFGTALATTMVGNLYRISSDVEPDKYLLQVGVARQEKWESGITEEAAIEQAANNALTDPKIQIEMEVNNMTDDDFENLCKMYISTSIDKDFFATDEELARKRFF